MQIRIPKSLTSTPEPSQKLDPGYNVTGTGGMTQPGLNKIRSLPFNRFSNRTRATSEAIDEIA
jgi:hypothetical protein